MTYVRFALIAGAALMSAGILPFNLPASAAVVDTPGCRARLVRAWNLVNGIAARDRTGVAKRDTVGLCRALRRNAVEMKEARDSMMACMTGHERAENVGQMDASLEDISYVLRARCAEQ